MAVVTGMLHDNDHALSFVGQMTHCDDHAHDHQGAHHNDPAPDAKHQRQHGHGHDDAHVLIPHPSEWGR